MASNMVYSIKLQLRVDDSQLDATIAQLGTLKKAAKDIHVKTAGGGYRRLQLPEEAIIARSARKWKQRNLEERLNIGARWHLRQFGQWRFSQAGWQNGLNVFQKRIKTFQDSFFNNVSSFSGLRYNAVNLGKVFTSLAGAAGKAIPALGTFAQVGKGAAKIWMGVHGWRLASSGLPLLVGTRLLNSNNMAEAASNLMQMRMAEKGLGGNYQATLNRATQLAAEYGFSRVGMLNAMNMFTGLNVDGKKLTPEEASHLAEVVGKIAHVGGLSFDRVNRNIQQLLAMAVPNSRDLNELTTQAPYIGKLAMNMMEERGGRGDYRVWLKNKSNLRSVLDEFNELVESHPVMKARGQIALAKENFWMRIADGLSPYWDKIAQANEKLYSWLGDKIVSWVNNIDVDAVKVKLDSFIRELNRFANIIGGIAKGIGTTVDLLSGGPRPTWSYDPATGTTHKEWIVGTRDDADERAAQSNKNSAFSTYINNIDGIVNQYALWAKILNKKFDKSLAYRIFNAPDFIQKFTANESNFRWDPIKWGKKWRGDWFFDGVIPTILMGREDDKNNPTEYKTTISQTGFKNLWAALSGAMAQQKHKDAWKAQADAAAKQLSDLSKGSKSIFINFNKEIVNMPVNIASVENIEELGRKLEPKIEEVVVRGLTIALNNATSVT